ncbi:hypothetical protein VLI49_001504 [Enterobacter kobei]|uniref:hypothetical protein n=1 Tax=Enterobacter kobei TaxID=208224 RepID=UPI001F51B918|nr:hypothetical protein [Enterobacter kobei]EMC7915981.1 hypothetical protein [Enterobacter kobei]MCH4291967.1 hypothetical protein [Enterobacter kobei]
MGLSDDKNSEVIIIMIRTNKTAVLIAVSFYLTLPVFNIIGVRYFQDAWIFNKLSILVVFLVFLLNLNVILKVNLKPFVLVSFAIIFLLVFSYLMQTLYGYELNVKTNNIHILLLTLLLFYFSYKSTYFDLSTLIFKPIFVVSVPLVLCYAFMPETLRGLSAYSINLIGNNSIFVDKEFRFSSIFSEPSKLAIFSGISLFYYMDRREKFMLIVSFGFLVLSMSKFAIVFVPVCIILSFLLRKVSFQGRIICMSVFVTSYMIFLTQHMDWFSYLYTIINYESLNTYETRFGFPIIALHNILNFPLGIGVFDGYRYIMLDGEFTISQYCNELIEIGGNCYEMNSYSYDSLAEFFPKDILSTLIFYFGFMGIVLLYIYGCYVATKISKPYFYYTPLYIFLCLLFVTSYDYMIIVLALMVLGDNKYRDVSGEKVC